LTNNGQIYWFGWLQNGAEGERQFDPTYGALYPYLGARGIETCPAFNYASPQLKLKATGASYGYGYNLALSAPVDSPPINMIKVGRPSELIFLGDAAQVNTFQAPASPDNPLLEEFYYVNTTEPTAHFRHGGRANAAFCDGHTGSERPAPGSLDTRLPREVIGRFRTDALTPDG
jgi:prepilin-type processing-associated H-X9-DG protein